MCIRLDAASGCVMVRYAAAWNLFFEKEGLVGWPNACPYFTYMINFKWQVAVRHETMLSGRPARWDGSLVALDGRCL